MNAVYALAVGLLVAIGIYQLMGKDLFRIAFGLYIILNALNLLVLAIATQHRLHAPLAGLGKPFTDPLVQAIRQNLRTSLVPAWIYLGPGPVFCLALFPW